MNHFLSIRDLSREEVLHLFRATASLKARQKTGDGGAPLAGRSLALIFEKQSLRTRVTFEVGMAQLGGAVVYLSAQEIGLGVRESVADIARNLSRWVDIIAARTFRHATVEMLANHATVPVINALSDLEHPCQALADFFTLWERGLNLSAIRLAWIGDGNNVCHSLLLLAALLGTPITVATPAAYAPDPGIQAAARALGARLSLTADPREAAAGADVLYTDVWISMGQEVEREKRLAAFQGYQINEGLLACARPGVLVMHCLPAHRGEEISDSVLDGPRSVVLDQSENRLHAQKAVLLHLLGAGDV